VNQLSSDTVAAFVRSYLDTAVLSVERVPGSVGNQDFLVSLPDGPGLVLKAGDARMLAAEGWACSRARAAGVAAPVVVAYESRSALPLPFLLLRWLPGAPSRDPEVLEEAGRQLRLAHAVALDGFGRLVVADAPTGSVAAGEHGSWAEVVESTLTEVHRLVTGGIVPQSLAAGAAAMVRAADLDFPGPGVLLHGDLKVPHIFGQQGRCTGIIDWGDASAGDPRLDLARFSMDDADAFAALLRGYGVPRTADLDAVLAAYRVLWNLEALVYEQAAGGDWFDVYRGRIEADLDGRRAG